MDVRLYSTSTTVSVFAPKRNPSDKAAEVDDARQAATGEAKDPTLMLTSLTARLAAQPVVDQARVERVGSAIRSGTYQIDPQKLAAKIIAFEEQLS